MKASSKFICRSCGFESAKWLGKCPSCSNWNTMDEVSISENTKSAYTKPISKTLTQDAPTPKKLNEIGYNNDIRIKTGNSELDRVLGGGIVEGSMVLVGGDPGIGKSTLLLQICDYLGSNNKVLYISGEESASQIKIRADRLKTKTNNLMILSETNLDNILYHANDIKPDVVIIDSIQTVFKPDVPSAPGSVGQVREATHFLMRLAKENNIAVFIVGHVTKDGNIAGPKILEHMVDCVLYFEGDRYQSYRILRTVKNRFGSTNEIGVFEMKDDGLALVENPSEMLISGRPKNVPGSTVVCTLEGTRPVLAEVQALSSASGFNMARRSATGIDYNRAIMLIAVLEKKLGYTMQNQDVYINVIGGIKINETATDLAVILAIASNYKGFVIDHETIVFGEVGLTGEVRAISYIERRINEAIKLGFKKCIVPYANLKSLRNIKNIEIIGINTVRDAIEKISEE